MANTAINYPTNLTVTAISGSFNPKVDNTTPPDQVGGLQQVLKFSATSPTALQVQNHLLFWP